MYIVYISLVLIEYVIPQRYFSYIISTFGHGRADLYEVNRVTRTWNSQDRRQHKS